MSGRRWSTGPDDRIVLVADLHLGAGEGPAWDEARSALVDLLRHLGTCPPRTLVLLGDTFELREPAGRPWPRRPAEAAALLRDLAAEHREVVAALRDLDRAGTELVLVAGNHDAALAHPQVSAALCEVLPASVHAWCWVAPGILWAEHGHEHHDVNHPGALLTLEDAGSPWWPQPSVAGALATARHEGAPGTRAVVGAAREVRRRDHASLGWAYHARQAAYADDHGLPADVLGRIDGPAHLHPTHAAARVSARVAAHRPTDAYLWRAAGRVARALEEAGTPLPVLAFGHTHRAAQRVLGASLAIGVGSWSPLRRERGVGWPHAEVRRSGTEVQARLLRFLPQ